ncbi:alpha/beta hydrolase [Nocardioides aquaticus]|nr:alpha/beta hydrolase [Nocardioides aquaticus]
MRDILVPGADGQLPARVYDPARRDDLPLLVYVHGGGWTLGSVQAADGPCCRLAETAKCRVVSVEYRLAPESPFPAAVEDCAAAIGAILDDPSIVDRPSSMVVTMGDSAGGNLVPATALQRRDDGSTQPHSLMLVYPCMTSPHENRLASMRENADAPMLSATTMAWYWDTYLDGRASDARVDLRQAASFSGLPRTLVVAADLNPLRNEALLVAENMERAEVDTAVSLYPGAVHGFWLLDGILEQTVELDHEIADFIASAAAPAPEQIALDISRDVPPLGQPER